MVSQGTQRRLAAILFTDVVGSTAATAQSAASGLALRDRHREVVRAQVERYHGRLIEAPGDESLSVFESALNAVNCARAIRGKLEGDGELQLHMGLHLGEIAFRGDEVFGDGVNVAARLCSLAPANEVYISAALADALRGQEGELSPRGDHAFRGVEQPVTVYQVGGAAGEPAAPEVLVRRPSGTTPWVAAAAFLLVILLGVWWLYRPTAVDEQAAPGFSGPPAIAVLPLENLSADPEHSFFADGLAEDLTTRLASWRSFPVIARGSAFAANLPENVQEVGRELGARYVVEGSVREAGDLVRIVVKLIDASTGRQVWASQYDRDYSDVLALQDEISEAIVGAMNPALLHSEIDRAMHQDPENLDAWTAAMRGWWHFDHGTKEHMAQARSYFARAIELDPQWGYAYAGLSLTHFWDAAFRWSDTPRESAGAAVQAAQTAVALDELSAEAHHAMGHAFGLSGQPDRMVGAFKEGVELNPSHHLANNCYGQHLALLGRWEEAIEYLDRAMSLSPRDPVAFPPQMGMAWAFFAAEDYAQALEWAEKSIQRAPHVFFLYTVGVASAAQLGDIDRAQRMLQERRQLDPPLTRPLIESGYAVATPAFRERLIDGLRKAGWDG
jgi:TolB-like protein/class 3 adenylate cyclase